ncbi:MAG: GGDEF domain-containing protein, partial [Planctomycetota bacterium]
RSLHFGSNELTTKQLLLEASRMADTLGFPCFKSSGPADTQEGSEVFTLLSESAIHAISNAVTAQEQAVSEVLDLPMPSESQMNASLLKIARQLSLVSADNIRKSRELEFRISMLRELREVSRGITKTFDSSSLSFSVLEALTEGFHSDGAFLLTLSSKGQLNGFAAKIPESDDVAMDTISTTIDKLSPVLEACIKEPNSALKVTAIRGDAFMESLLGDVSLAWIASLKSQTKDRVSGLVGIGVRDKESFKFNSSDFGETFTVAASEIGFALENARLYNIVLKESRFDPLTNLFNRRTIMKILSTEFSRYKRKPDPLSVVIFDLDNFKCINDNRGHLAGDDYLRKISSFLRTGVRDSDYIGRYGGDEFLGIFPDTPASKVHIIVDRIREMINTFCEEFGGEDLGKKLSLSAGITGACPAMSRSEELIQLADTALYSAKEKGRNQCVLIEAPATLLKA